MILPRTAIRDTRPIMSPFRIRYIKIMFAFDMTPKTSIRINTKINLKKKT